MNLHFTFECRTYLDVFGVSIGSAISTAEYVKRAFNPKGKYKNLAVVVHVLQNTKNFVISRCCFVENDKEMYQNLKRMYRAIILLISLFVW